MGFHSCFSCGKFCINSIRIPVGQNLFISHTNGDLNMKYMACMQYFVGCMADIYPTLVF